MLIKEVAAQHVQAIHYSSSTSIRVGVGKAISADTNPRFWQVVLDKVSKRKLKKGEVDRVEKCVHNVTGWSYPVVESTSFVEAACLN